MKTDRLTSFWSSRWNFSVSVSRDLSSISGPLIISLLLFLSLFYLHFSASNGRQNASTQFGGVSILVALARARLSARWRRQGGQSFIATAGCER
jgi:hypothetical protein